MDVHDITNITIVGSGTIGLSFAALYLNQSSKFRITIYDTRSDIEDYVKQTLPKYLFGKSPVKDPTQISTLLSNSTLTLTTSLESAVSTAHIIHEQIPEHLSFKQEIWSAIESHAPTTTHFWTSTSGIPASSQNALMRNKSRLLVVHPFNPPHILPLLEIVPSPETSPTLISQAVSFTRDILRRTPIVLKREVPGFVANRLAFSLLREAVHLVATGVVDVKDLDDLVTASMGPRWAVAGPFRSYASGGGEDGLEGFMRKIGGTVQDVWDDLGSDVRVDGGWRGDVCGQASRAYGEAELDVEKRDQKTERVLEVVREGEK